MKSAGCIVKTFHDPIAPSPHRSSSIADCGVEKKLSWQLIKTIDHILGKPSHPPLQHYHPTTNHGFINQVVDKFTRYHGVVRVVVALPFCWYVSNDVG